MHTPPTETEFAPFYAGYVAAVPPGNVMDTLRMQAAQIQQLTATLTEERETFRYAPGKWSVREVVSHMTDAERVFGYRAFCISRGEAQPLPSFDENAYAEASDAHARPLASLVDEFARVRAANLDVFERLDEAAWPRLGVASGKPVSVRALAYIMAGHVAHHLGILRTRYGIG